MAPRARSELTRPTSHLSRALQGFRKYLNQATDHEELLSFLLGQLVKEKALLYSNLHGEAAEEVVVKLVELEERAKELEIYETSSFLKSALFKRNGYSVQGGKEIVKKFEKRVVQDEEEGMDM